MSRRWVPLLAVPVALAGFACGGRSVVAPTPEPAGTATATATPSETPTATPRPTASVSATATKPSATAPAPTPTPPRNTASPPPRTPTATPPRTPVAGRIVSNGPRDVTKVALTFDMGGRVDPAVAIMTWLETNGVKATVFMTGAIIRNVNTDAGRVVLQRVAARPELFDIANHSDTHPDFTTLTTEEMAAELAATEREIARFVKASPRPFFRPPFGAQNAAVVAGVASAGYPVTVMWDVDTIDWRPEADGGPTADGIVAKVLAQAKAGSIVLMHLGGFNTLDALPRIVAGLKAAGLEPVTLSELLGVARD